MDLFGLGKVSKHPEELELLTTVYDNIQLAVIRSILDGAEIPYMVKERGSGSSVKIITGFSMFGTDIFVRKEDLETAEGLLSPADGEAEITEDEIDGSDEEADKT